VRARAASDQAALFTRPFDSTPTPCRPGGLSAHGAGVGACLGQSAWRRPRPPSFVDGASVVVEQGQVLEFAIPTSDTASDSILLLAEWRRRIVSYSTQSGRGCAILDRRACANGATR
jgi:hypothetical protein